MLEFFPSESNFTKLRKINEASASIEDRIYDYIKYMKMKKIHVTLNDITYHFSIRVENDIEYLFMNGQRFTSIDRCVFLIQREKEIIEFLEKEAEKIFENIKKLIT